jgi:hypothetical protein
MIQVLICLVTGRGVHCTCPFALPCLPQPIAHLVSHSLSHSHVTLPVTHVQVEPQRNITTIRLPCQGLPAICALQHPSSSNSSSFEGRGAASSGMSELATLPEEEEQVRGVCIMGVGGVESVNVVLQS